MTEDSLFDGCHLLIHAELSQAKGLVIDIEVDMPSVRVDDAAGQFCIGVSRIVWNARTIKLIRGGHIPGHHLWCLPPACQATMR